MNIKHLALLVLVPVLLSCAAPEKTFTIPAPPQEEDNPSGPGEEPGDDPGDDPGDNPSGPSTPPAGPGQFIVVGYVTYWGSITPNPEVLTHINYAFGKVGSDFETLDIRSTSRLKKGVALKQAKPGLKVVLSVGGWGAGNFSEMAADENHRKKFCENCLKAVNQYGLDGIDLDWEYPTSSSAGISSSPDDTKNFTLLVKDLRATLGPDLLVTMASSANAKYVSFKDFIDYMDFVNLMTYDMGNPPKHNAALYPSSMTRRSCDESVALHHAAGVPYEKMTLGMAFYGRDNGSAFTAGDDDNFVYYRDIKTDGFVECWDDAAKVPYLTDYAGNMVLSYDNETSIGLKADYVRDKGLLGAMYWAIEGDDDAWTLSRAISSRLLDTGTPAVGIKAELDLRETSSVPESAYFLDAEFCGPGFGESENYRTMLRDCPDRVKTCFEFIVDNLRKGNPVYFHCAAGRDRTGTIAALCLGVLGVREGDIAKDYELTYFAPDEWSMSTNKETGSRFYDHTRHVGSYKRCVEYLRDCYTGSGKTLKKGAETYLRNIGVSQQDIDDFRTIMLK